MESTQQVQQKLFCSVSELLTYISSRAGGLVDSDKCGGTQCKVQAPTQRSQMYSS